MKYRFPAVNDVKHESPNQASIIGANIELNLKWPDRVLELDKNSEWLRLL
jgi:hypothetical protein